MKEKFHLTENVSTLTTDRILKAMKADQPKTAIDLAGDQRKNVGKGFRTATKRGFEQ